MESTSTREVSSLGDSSSSTDDATYMHEGITHVVTVGEMLVEGLKLAGFDQAMQARQPKSNLGDFC